MTEVADGLTPGEFARQLLKALEASEGRTMRRKRDQLPDVIGLGIKRGLLARVAQDDPPAGAFEGWLMEQALGASASGGILAMCAEILDEYRLAALDPTFYGWLAAGAPSADAEQPGSEDNGRARAERRLGSGDQSEPTYPLTQPVTLGEDRGRADSSPASLSERRRERTP